MLAIRTVLTVAVAFSPIAAAAAELPVAEHQNAHVVHIHRMHVGYGARAHIGYYFGQTGSRWGGTASYWYASRFAFGGAPALNGMPGAVAGPRRAAAIVCYERPPTVCLSEPVVRPVALDGPPRWR
jgi:hypothetical protein